MTMTIKQTKRTNKTLWYPSQKNAKPDKDLLKSAVSEFLAEGRQITKCETGTKKP
jgi:hypothetical protein